MLFAICVSVPWGSRPEVALKFDSVAHLRLVQGQQLCIINLVQFNYAFNNNNKCTSQHPILFISSFEYCSGD